MGIKKFKPTTPTLRFKTTLDFSDIDKDGVVEKSLCKPIKKTGGRNSNGRITSRRRGGGHKRIYRIIDFKRDKKDIEAVVDSIQYDPNRSANIALLFYKDGEKRYIIAPNGLKKGDTVVAAETAPLKPGNTMPLKSIPAGINVFGIEFKPGKGAQIARSAGSYCVVMAKENNMVLVKLPSTEIRKFNENCCATIGEVGNEDHNKVVIGSAGKNRWLGRRPKVRGVAMNPVDHPMGGGEGKSSGGGHPVSPWGQLAKGKKTRRSKKESSKFIISRRTKKR